MQRCLSELYQVGVQGGRRYKSMDIKNSCFREGVYYSDTESSNRENPGAARENRCFLSTPFRFVVNLAPPTQCSVVIIKLHGHIFLKLYTGEDLQKIAR